MARPCYYILVMLPPQGSNKIKGLQNGHIGLGPGVSLFRKLMFLFFILEAQEMGGI